MNTKASNVAPGTSAADLLKYVLAALVAAAGVAVFYFLPTWPAPVRGLLVVLGFAGALGIVSLTAVGLRGREFFSESLFELRKVVWPTRQEATRITGVVLLVVMIISLILAGFDFVISWLIKLLLSN
ncbi:MAG: preprotein translocase subunit SecE [Arenimonas sp.]|jgi:preprotein translocase subunit SecE